MDVDDKRLEARFFLNMKRVGALIDLVTSRSLAAATGPLESDISRAAVVFLHATFEDMLRTAARQLPTAVSSGALTKIPLSGMPGRAEKFHLEALVKHRGKTVDELLRESVEAYWNRMSFSECDDVEQALR
jgi:hypothetical protein